jgi:hypothetical protein
LEGRALQEEGHGGAVGLPCLLSALLPVRVKVAVRGSLLCVRGRKQEEGKKRRKKKKKKKGKKRKKYDFFFKLGNFPKNKR